MIFSSKLSSMVEPVLQSRCETHLILDATIPQVFKTLPRRRPHLETTLRNHLLERLCFITRQHGDFIARLVAVP